MKLQFKYILPLLSLFVVSCTKTKVGVGEQSEKIIFTATNHHPSVVDTRAAGNHQNLPGAYLFDNPAKFQSKSGRGGYFNVMAYKTGTDFEHFVYPAPVIYYDQAPDPNDYAWYIYNPSLNAGKGDFEDRYWPVTFNLDFLAYMPLLRPQDGTTSSTLEIDPSSHITSVGYLDAPVFHCTGLPLDADGQSTATEFMYAWITDQSQTSTRDGKVPLQFKHPMSAVIIEISGAHGGTEINSLGFKNIYNNGTFNVADGQWTMSGAKGSLIIDELDQIYGQDIQKGKTYGPYLVLPQDFRPAGNDAPENDILFTIDFTWDVNTIVDRPLFKDAEAGNAPPVNKWEPGKIYTYSVTLGDGAEDIKLNISVESWDDVGEGFRDEIEVQ